MGRFPPPDGACPRARRVLVLRQRSFSRFWIALLALVSTVLVSGCSPAGAIVRPEQPARTGMLALRPDGSLGQTFTARYDGFDGIALYLEPDGPAAGVLRLRLFSSPEDKQPLAQAEIPVERITAPSFYRFSFPPQPDSTGKSYYARISLIGDGQIQAGTAPAEFYLDGARYQNGLPEEGQLTFRLAYRTSAAARELLEEGLHWLLWLAAAAFLFLLPGLALLSWGLQTKTGSRFGPLDVGTRLGLAAGLSLALYPLLLLWTGLIGLRLGALYAWTPPLIALVYLALRSNRRSWKRAGWSLPPWNWVGSAPNLALLIVTALIFAVRLWGVRRLAAPMWGDSLSHTIITSLLVDHGGLFQNWQPFAPLESFTYHFGFHSAAAVFHWITRMPVDQAVLTGGQILNGLAALALYPLAARIGRSPWAGVAAVLLAGLLLPMPMFYANWGRYTQLAGQAALPAAIFLAWLALEASPQKPRVTDWRLLALVWLAFAGLALIHYRVLILAILFFPAYFLLQFRPGRFRSLIQTGLLTGLGAGLLFLPWFIHVFAGRILDVLFFQLSTPAEKTSAFFQEYNAIGDLFTYLPAWAWLGFILALAWGLWRRSLGAALTGLWWGLNLLAANPQWLRLPGVGAIGSFTVLIAAYFPAAVLIGAAAGWALEATHRPVLAGGGWPAKLIAAGLLVVILAASLWGAPQRLQDIQPGIGVLYTHADERAAAWIDTNLPASSRFLINSFMAYGGTIAVGSDGGWWLPVRAGRAVTVPPINYSSEQGPRPDYQMWVNALAEATLNRGATSPEVKALLEEHGVSHVYIGQRHGGHNYSGPVLEAEAFLNDPDFRPVYHQDRVWIFAFQPQEAP